MRFAGARVELEFLVRLRCLPAHANAATTHSPPAAATTLLVAKRPDLLPQLLYDRDQIEPPEAQLGS